MTIADTLREARRRIEEPEKWGKGHELLNGKRCAWTALYSCRLDAMSPERGKAEAIFRSAIDGGSIWKWNDAPERTHMEVMQAFDKAIELAEKAEEKT